MNAPPIYAPPSPAVKAYLGIKRLVYRLCKLLGLFEWARRLTRRGLRVIVYHGFCLDDECAFSPRTFIDPAKFRKRMTFLQSRGFPILGLERALELLEKNEAPDNAIVITIDDGFFSTYRGAVPVLREYGIPATVYVTTYYAVNEHPVFNLAVQYLLWKTERRAVSLDGLGLPESGTVGIETAAKRNALAQAVLAHGERRCGEAERFRLAAALADRLGIDFDRLVESRILNVMNVREIEELARWGIDIELHTHRHRFPADKAETIREIAENREVLEPLAGKGLAHLCYPSGVYCREQWPWLREAGIRSAVTTERGLNYRGVHPYAVKRFGDDDLLSQIEFEAEVYGFTDIIRRFPKNLIARLRDRSRSAGGGRGAKPGAGPEKPS
jgi:peptidoglycan/xylan/chitin deacetylase (PgdA/CDA1 family)